MEEKERYEVMSPSLNGYAYIHDFKTDNVLNTYDSCDLLNQQSKRIKELQQQLAEKEKEIADLQLQLQQANEIINNPDTLIFQQQQLIDNLKSRLAEKDKEIGGIKKQSLENIELLYENATLIENLNDCNMMLSCLNRIKAGTPYIIQEVDVKLEKYDFAVKQLERVKEFVNEIYGEYSASVTTNFIDNQINELKGEK